MKSPFTFRPTGRTSAGPVAQSTPGTDHIPRTVQTHVDVCLRARPGGPPVRPEDVRTKQTGRAESRDSLTAVSLTCRRVELFFIFFIFAVGGGKGGGKKGSHITSPKLWNGFHLSTPLSSLKKRKKIKAIFVSNHCVCCCCRVHEL